MTRYFHRNFLVLTRIHIPCQDGSSGTLGQTTKEEKIPSRLVRQGLRLPWVNQLRFKYRKRLRLNTLKDFDRSTHKKKLVIPK